LEFGRSSSRRTSSKYSRKIEKTRDKNKKVIRIVEEIKKVRVKVLRDNKWQIE